MIHFYQKLITLLAIIILSSNIAIAQSNIEKNTTENSKKEKHTKFSFYGWVRNDFTFDSRLNYAAVGELFYFMPLDQKLNEYGEDLNAVPNTRLLAITSRAGVDMHSAIQNCLINAKIEADFCGAYPNIVTLRIRQAYVNFLWDSSHKLLVGQTWHPMSEGMLPSIVSLNTGAPFNPFSRAPQIRYDYINPNFEVSASATYQLQYSSSGPNGADTKYQYFGGAPEINIGAKYKYKNLTLNLQGNYLGIKPRTTGKDNKGVDVKVSDFSHSFSGSLFASYKHNLLDIKARTIIGQNLGHVLMLSGYGVSAMNNDGSWEYSSITQSSSWVNVSYGEKLILSLFGGYMKNLGSNKDIVSPDKIYIRGANNIDQIFRIAPSARYNFKDLCIGLEYEYTGVQYGKTINPNATAADTHHIGNHRIYAMLIYSFRTK